MKKNKVDNLLISLAILGVGGCIASLYRIFVGYFSLHTNLMGGEGYWDKRLIIYFSVFACSLFITLSCWIVYRMRKKGRIR